MIIGTIQGRRSSLLEKEVLFTEDGGKNAGLAKT